MTPKGVNCNYRFANLSFGARETATFVPNKRFQAPMLGREVSPTCLDKLFQGALSRPKALTNFPANFF